MKLFIKNIFVGFSTSQNAKFKKSTDKIILDFYFTQKNTLNIFLYEPRDL